MDREEGAKGRVLHRLLQCLPNPSHSPVKGVSQSREPCQVYGEPHSRVQEKAWSHDATLKLWKSLATVSMPVYRLLMTFVYETLSQ